jgi:hypothetical protein
MGGRLVKEASGGVRRCGFVACRASMRNPCAFREAFERAGSAQSCRRPRCGPLIHRVRRAWHGKCEQDGSGNGTPAGGSADNRKEIYMSKLFKTGWLFAAGLALVMVTGCEVEETADSAPEKTTISQQAPVPPANTPGEPEVSPSSAAKPCSCGEGCKCGSAEGGCKCGSAEGGCKCGSAEGGCKCGSAEGGCKCGSAEGGCKCGSAEGGCMGAHQH